jgi:ABC-type sugar transport system permease subunit
MLNSQVGLINDWLVRLGILEQFRSWTGSPDTALPVLILVNIWRGFPFMAIVLLAALQSIPKELYEATAVDGAGRLQQFRDVTMPGLRYTVAIVTTISAIWAFKEFTLIEILTEGGPAGASEVVGTLVYRMFFRFSRFGDAAALGVLILIILFIVSLFYVRLISSAEERGKD